MAPVIFDIAFASSGEKAQQLKNHLTTSVRKEQGIPEGFPGIGDIEVKWNLF